MPTELKNILLTVPFIVLLVVMFFWLLRAIVPGVREQAAEFKKDKFDLAGYETIAQIRRKEYSVIGVGAFTILFCLGIILGLGYLLYQAGIAGQADSVHALNLLFLFLPAIVLIGIIISASRHYMKHQELTLQEFQKFKTSRHKAISEYQAKRSGKQEDKEKPEKTKGQKVRKTVPPTRERGEKKKPRKPRR